MKELEEEEEEWFQFLSSFREKKKFTYVDKIADLISFDRKTFTIDFLDIAAEHKIIKQFQFGYNVIENANKAVLKLINVENQEYFTNLEKRERKIYTRFQNFPYSIKLGQIESANVNEFRAMEGIVTRVSEMKPIILRGVFQCNVDIEHQISKNLPGGILIPPNVCNVPGCQGTKFGLLLDYCSVLNWQMITIQELQEESVGSNPTSFSCRLLDDLVKIVRPGDRIRLTGIIRIGTKKKIKKGDRLIYDFWIDTNYIEKLEENLEDIEISDAEENKFLEMAKSKQLQNMLISSLAPELKGLRIIKEGLLYFLFAGVEKIQPNGFKTRGQPNVLLVGDPSMGKSQILKFINRLIPRSVYTSGKGSSAAGLTAAVSRDVDTGELTLEAGAMVLADTGITIIDEFEKMSEIDRSAIHEAMEQGTVSIAKAGIIATLNARTGVLAAANPVAGNYMPEQSLNENINLSAAILSRFDFIFILHDVPEEKTDRQLAEHILDLHSNSFENDKLISIDILRRYIYYAKQNYKPVLTKKAQIEIADYFVTTRNPMLEHENKENQVLNFTARQLEGVIRISEARARMHLRNKVTVADARAAIKIMRQSIETVTTHEDVADATVINSGVSKKHKDIIKSMVAILATIKTKKITKEKLYDLAERQGYSTKQVEEAIQLLMRNGTIIIIKSNTIILA